MKSTAPSGLVRLPFFLLLVACASVIGAGCAPRKAKVIARHNTQYPLSVTNRIALADHVQPRLEEQALRVTLLNELQSRGFQLVAPDQADYTLTYWIDVSWRKGEKVMTDVNSSGMGPMLDQPAGQMTIYSQSVVAVEYEIKGIRLKVFPRDTLRTGRMETAWDGYIEVSYFATKKLKPILVRTLLSYFGQNFVGKATLLHEP